MNVTAAVTELFIESREDRVRRCCGALSLKERKRMSARKFIRDFTSNKHFDKLYHDSDPLDRGYIQVHDAERSRTIFVTDKQSGLSEAFHLDKQINCFFNVTDPVNLHLSYIHMEIPEKEWQVHNLMYVALQIYETDGNVALLCNHGRSRSPMYLVVYMIIFNDLSVLEATNRITMLLRQQRGLELDRFNALGPAAQVIFENRTT